MAPVPRGLLRLGLPYMDTKFFMSLFKKDNEEPKKSPSEILGYYYVLFQTTFTGFVKCWIDGSENYTYFTVKDFINLFEKIGAPFEVIYKVKDCLDTSCIYLWDVSNSSIKQMRPQTSHEYLTSEINKMNPFFVKENRFSSK